MRLPQALSGWQRWLGGKILLVQVTEGKMHLERRGWEGLTEHQKKGEENRNRRKKKVEESSDFIWCLCCCYIEQSLKTSEQRIFRNMHSWPRSLSLMFRLRIPLFAQKPAPDLEDLTQLRAIR